MENEIDNVMINDEKQPLVLELGDIIQIESPSHIELHQMVAYIEYIDNTQIHMIDTSTSNKINLQIKEDGTLFDESIKGIILLSRSSDKGFAKQNDLHVNSWVNLKFGGEIPQLITGQITNLEEDMIEITTWPELNVFYIDFAYKGIPLDVPLQEITLREKPLQLKNVSSLANLKEPVDAEEQFYDEESMPSIEYSDLGESIINIPENALPDENFKNKLEELYIDVDSIQFGEKLEAVAQLVEVPENEQRFSIDVQVNDMMDELLSTIPNHLRSKTVLHNIHNLISRFKELREQFSTLDTNNTVVDYKKYNSYYKPLVERIHKIDTNLKWIVPVVKQRNKLHPSSEENEIELEDNNDYVTENIGNVVTNIEALQSQYYGKTKNSFDYENYEKEMQVLTAPFEETIEKDSCLYSNEVQTDLDAIVENLEDFHSSVYKQSKLKGVYTVSKEKFLLQRYNLGLEKNGETVLKNGKSIFKKELLTNNDEICVNSIMMLPETAIRYSELYFPSTSLLKKANLHFEFFSLSKLLKNNKEIIPHVIDDLSKEFSYYEKKGDQENKELEEGQLEQGEENTQYVVKENFFKQFHQFLLDEDTVALSNDKFKDFLENIIPKTKVLTEIVRKYVKDKISFFHVIKEMEPFMVYSDNISYKQYLSIRRLIVDKIKTLKSEHETKNNDLLFIKNAKFNVNYKKSNISLLLAEKENISDNVFDLYKLNEKVSTHEAIKNIYEMDNGKLYFEVLQSIMYSLLNPENLIISLSNVEDVTDVEKIKPDNCGTKYLSKKYTSIEDLQEDNDKEIFFDFEFDDTPYNILDKYKDEQEKMEEALFFNFLIENLIAKHECMEEKASELAKTLIAEKKTVENGHYAILELKPKLMDNIDESKLTEKEKMEIEIESEIKKKITYFKRINNNWISDDSLNDKSFIENNELFCNMSEFCFKNRKTKECEPKGIVQARYRDYTKQSLIDEFENRFAMTMEEIEQKIEKHIEIYSNNIRKLYRNKILKENASNNIAYQLSNYANDEPVLLSPYIYIRDKILSINDYPKKQNYICLFVEKFCRAPLVENLKENQNWHYCKKTNTKLFPFSLYEIAKVFIDNHDIDTLNDFIFKKYGTESDDGDAIVDKYSGYVLKKKEFVMEEKYNEQGQKVSSHEIMQEELGTITEKQMKNMEKVYENEMNQMNYNILKSLCTNIGIKLNNVEDFVKSHAASYCENGNYILTEEKYKKKSEKLKKQDKKPLGPYKAYRNERRIYIVSSLLLVAIQTSTPSMHIRKTFPGCIKSFDGYPQTGIENINAVKYLSCVLFNMKSKFEPWNSIDKLNQEKIKNRLLEIVEKFVITSNEIQEKYNTKREYVELHPENFLPEQHAIENWKHFSPPLVKTNVQNKLENVTVDYEKEFNHQVRKNSKTQDTMIRVLYNKNRLFTYGLKDVINELVENKTLLLKTRSEEPFMENACCNDSLLDVIPLVYFSKDEPLILQYVKNMSSNQKIIKYISDLSHPQILFHNSATRIIYPSLPTGFLEKDIYQVIIYYLNLDKNEPIPLYLKEFMDEKPSYYKSEHSIEEKIVTFKKNGKRFGVSHLHEVLNLVNRKNMVHVNQFKNFNKLHAFKDVIETLIEKECNIIKKPCLEHLLNILEDYEPKKMYSDFTEKTSILHNYLEASNKNMKIVIDTFFKTFSNLNNRDQIKMQSFLHNLHKWNTDNEDLTNIENYFHEMFHNICIIYPTLLKNNSNMKINIPSKRMNFSDKHTTHLENFFQKHYSGLESFKEDAILLKLLDLVTNEMKDVFRFAEHIPIFNLYKNNDTDYYSFLKNETYYQLYLYVFYCILEFYIESVENEDLIIKQTYLQKENAIQQIEENRDPSNYIESANSMINDLNIDRSNDLDEVLIYTGQKEELNKKVAGYMVMILEIEKSNKNTIDISYEDIMKRVNRAKEREKQNMIGKLEELTKEERKVEDKFKLYRLDKWNIGQQKGLIEYNKDVYEREVNELIEQMGQEFGSNLLDVNQYEGYENMGVFIEDLENNESEQRNEEEDLEFTNINNLGEHFMDGQYYEEDIENDF